VIESYTWMAAKGQLLHGRALILTAVVLLVLWALPIVEQFTAHPGNITQIWTFFVSEPHKGQRFANALYAKDLPCSR